MVQLAEHAEGVLFTIRVRAGARRNEVGGVHNGMLKVAVTQAPEKGKANRAVLDLLAKALAVPRSRLELVTGLTSPEKRVLIRGLALAELEQRLAPLVD